MFNIGEKDRRVRENMKRNGELEMLMNEIPNPNSPYLNISSPRHQLVNGSPMSRVSLKSESSLSSSFSNGFCSSEDGSPYHQIPTTHYLKNVNGNGRVVDELGLSQNFHRMHIGDEQRDGLTTRTRMFDGYGFDDSSLGGGITNNTIPWNVGKRGEYEGFSNGVSGFEGFQSSNHGVPMSFNDNMRLELLGLRNGCRASDSMGSYDYLAHNQSNALYSDPICSKNHHMNYLLQKRNEHGSGGCYYRGVQVQNPATIRPYLNDGSICSPRRREMDSNGVRGFVEPLSPPQLIHHPKLALNVDNSLTSHSIINGRTRAIPNSMVPQSIMKGASGVDAFASEDSFIVQGNSLNYAINKKSNASRGHKKNSCVEIAAQSQRGRSSELDSYSSIGRICENGRSLSDDCPLPLSPTFSSLAEVQGYIYFMAKDQLGCRSLQKVFDEGTCQDVQIIFEEIIGHVVELMMDPFGNYLVQKLLDVCNEEQRMQIVLMVTNEPGQLVQISLHTHGTRVVQKLVETVKTRRQISLVKSALEPGFLDLIKDLNGNHVIQRCLQCLSNEDNKFIFVAAANFCVDIATHRHGCCVLQRCIACSVGEHQDKLVSEISRNGLLLAQDPFGNYVVQYIIELKIPSSSARLISQFKGNYIQLAMQKFSSHVVEKCLKHFEETRPRIIRELLSVSHFEQLLQDPYANYVIQSALAVTKGPLHASLVEAVRAHMILRTSPYCKRIFTRKLLKK